MIFQQRIDKAYELRIAYINGSCFAGRVDASKTEHGKIDWRLVSPNECSWMRAELPEQVCGCIHRLMTALNLSIGAIDMIVTPEVEYVFLEVNPGGEWGMLERDLGLPISDAIAEALTEKH